MGFCKMMELLQIKNKGKIVLCNAGNFYIAIGKDAILLHELLELKLTCLKPEVCKVGFPILSLEKYTDLIQEKGYSYIVYFFDKEKVELEILMQYEGKQESKIKGNNNNCYICKQGIKAYKKADKYIMALAKLYEQETKEKIEKTKKKEKRKIWFRNKKKKTN